jgi:uncharacterized protein (TIGR03435 family)
MRRAILVTILSGAGLGQAPETPLKFEVADVHVSAKATNPFMRTGPVRGGRYEIKNATMVDLIRTAYGFDANKILGGPSWLEMDRFDVVAKVPPETTPETHKLMLQSLLADRFQLAIRKETKPLPTYALIVGKKPQLKEADGTEEPGCHPQGSSGGPSNTVIKLMTDGPSGAATTIDLGADMTIHFVCRNTTMASFAAGLRGMMGANVGENAVLDETGLKGSWNFDVKWSMDFIGPMGAGKDKITVFDAVEKQLGLKLEQRQVPTPVLVVEKVNEKPTENPPGWEKELPPTPVPTEFEVASVKPSDPGGRGGRMRMQPGGRFTVENMPLRPLLSRAFNTNNRDQFVNLPGWIDRDRFDINAKTSAAATMGPGMDFDMIAPMVRALLVDRFKLAYHMEDRPVEAYTLVAAKPKMKKADPSSRTSCKYADAPAGSPPGAQSFTCQNATMAQFADRLQNMTPELSWPVLDSTGLEGGWNFTLTYSRFPGMGGGRGGRGGDGPVESAVPAASEPTGAFTLFEAVEKQLGLKLEMRKRTLPVIVIDHLEQKPTEN